MCEGIIPQPERQPMRWWPHWRGPLTFEYVTYPDGAEGPRIMQHLLCPEPGCPGEIIEDPSGRMWPTGSPGYWHYCTECGVGYAIHDVTYPHLLEGDAARLAQIEDAARADKLAGVIAANIQRQLSDAWQKTLTNQLVTGSGPSTITGTHVGVPFPKQP